VCEECHGPESLHNIQADSNNDGKIEPGKELAGYGHVGKDNGPGDSDCWGCHGFVFPSGASTAPFTGPIIPTVFNSDDVTITAGKAATVYLSGSAFTNTTDGTKYDANVRLTAANGSSVTLKPDLVLDQGNLAVTIPATTRPGNYRLQATKGNVASNSMVLTVSPAVRIVRATLQGKMLTILGSGFSGFAKGSPTSVIATGGGVGNILSWTDTKIVAGFARPPKEVTVNSVFGSAKSAVSLSGTR